MAKGARLPISFVPPSTGSQWPVEHWGLIHYFLTLPSGKQIGFRELSRRAGLNYEMLHRILHGVTKPNLEAGLKIAGALNKSPWVVLEFTKRVAHTWVKKKKPLSDRLSALRRSRP